MDDAGLADLLIEAQEGDKAEMDKIIQLLLSKDNINHNTQLTSREVTAFSVLNTFRYLGIETLNNFVDDNLQKRVSLKRAGRKEWIEMLKPQLQRAQEMEYGYQGQPPRGGRGFMRRR